MEAELDNKINEIENRLFGKKLAIEILSDTYICDRHKYAYKETLQECLRKGETAEALQDFLYEVRSSVESYEDHLDLLESIEEYTY